MSSEQVEEFDCALEKLLSSRFPGEELEIPHRIFVVMARPPIAEEWNDGTVEYWKSGYGCLS